MDPMDPIDLIDGGLMHDAPSGLTLLFFMVKENFDPDTDPDADVEGTAILCAFH